MVQLRAADADAARRDDDLVVALLDDVAADFPGDLSEFVDDVFDGAVLRAEARDVRDDEVAVVHRVLDSDDVLLSVDLRDVELHAGLRRVRVEVLDVEFDVVLGGTTAPTENLVHEAHWGGGGPPPA